MNRIDIERDDMRVLAMVTAAAEADSPCPSNEQIASVIGAASGSRGSGILDRLARNGLIEIERGNQNRVVTIVATGKRTAGVVTKPHWRFQHQHIARKVTPRPSPMPVTRRGQMLPPAVNRDPCSRCGTRADIGCAHSVSAREQHALTINGYLLRQTCSDEVSQ